MYVLKWNTLRHIQCILVLFILFFTVHFFIHFVLNWLQVQGLTPIVDDNIVG